jgi:hypothetical protein
VYDTKLESLEQQTKYLIINYNADILFDLPTENEITRPDVGFTFQN